MSIHGLGPMVCLNASFTSACYFSLLGDHSQPFMDFMYLHNDGILQQENALCHWAQLVKNRFEEHSGEFRQTGWPA
ncbi:hypothetical protein P4O66_010935, partial [Electrophorus voltai]